MVSDDFKAGMDAFHAEHKGMIEGILVRPDLRGISPERVAVVLQAVGHWMRLAEERSKRERFLCMTCETTFHARRMPDAFFIMFAFAGDPARCVTSGICRKCADRDDEEMLKVAELGMRKLYPKLTVINPGRA